MPALPDASRQARRKAAAKDRRERRFFCCLAFAIAGWSLFFGTAAATAWTAFTASMLGMTLGTVRFLFPNVLSEPPNKVKVGFPGQYEEGKVSEQFKDKNMWIKRQRRHHLRLEHDLQTHLGCTPNWLEREGKFKCPCHGSGFKITGINFEGPAPRPLERWSIGIGEDGQIVVDKSRKFQQEMGQWTNSDSYLKT